jgi:hypothetical protein
VYIASAEVCSLLNHEINLLTTASGPELTLHSWPSPSPQFLMSQQRAGHAWMGGVRMCWDRSSYSCTWRWLARMGCTLNSTIQVLYATACPVLNDGEHPTCSPAAKCHQPPVALHKKTRILPAPRRPLEVTRQCKSSAHHHSPGCRTRQGCKHTHPQLCCCICSKDAAACRCCTHQLAHNGQEHHTLIGHQVTHPPLHRGSG